MPHTKTTPRTARLNLDNLDAHVRDLIEPLLNMRREIETTRVRCGIIGRSGAGKSSLINAIVGEKIAEVGVTEQTMVAQEFHHGGLTFVDLPGCGTKNHPRATYVERLGLEDYDCFILVTSTRFYEDDAYLYEQLAVKVGRPVFIVRTKLDEAVTAGARDNNLAVHEVEAKLRQEVLTNLAEYRAGLPPAKVYLTSAWYPGLYNLPSLVADMMGALGGVKRERFAADAAAYSESVLRAKRNVADTYVAGAAAAAFANGFNPVFGLDIGADLAILVGLGHKILHIYGLTEAQLNFTQSVVPPEDAAFKAGKILAARMATQFVTTEGVGFLLRQMGTKTAARYASKWLPIVGQLFSASLGSKMTYDFGGEAIEAAEKAARRILEGVSGRVGSEA